MILQFGPGLPDRTLGGGVTGESFSQATQPAVLMQWRELEAFSQARENHQLASSFLDPSTDSRDHASFSADSVTWVLSTTSICCFCQRQSNGIWRKLQKDGNFVCVRLPVSLDCQYHQVTFHYALSGQNVFSMLNVLAKCTQSAFNEWHQFTCCRTWHQNEHIKQTDLTINDSHDKWQKAVILPAICWAPVS